MPQGPFLDRRLKETRQLPSSILVERDWGSEALARKAQSAWFPRHLMVERQRSNSRVPPKLPARIVRADVP
jgi:hypothetical protein